MSKDWEIDEQRLWDAAYAAARLYERAPEGEGLGGAVSRMMTGIMCALSGLSEDQAVEQALGDYGYGVPPFPEPWVRVADHVARLREERIRTREQTIRRVQEALRGRVEETLLTELETLLEAEPPPPPDEIRSGSSSRA